MQVTGVGSSLHLDACTLTGGAHDAVLVADQGARLELSGVCVVSGCPAGGGCRVHGEGSVVAASGCTFSGNERSGVCVHMGGRADLEACALSGSLLSSGLHVSGNGGSSAAARGCSMSGNREYGVELLNDVCAELDGCSAEGNGLGSFHAHDGRSRLVLRGCSWDEGQPPINANIR